MKAATVKELRNELSKYSQKELIDICLRLSKFKKENKELLSYLLYESEDEEGFVINVKNEIDSQFDEINTYSFFYIKKSMRKVLRNAKKYIRYSKNKESEVEILLHFCKKMKSFSPSINRSKVLKNVYARQLEHIRKCILKLHEDLQYDYEQEMEELGM